MLVDAEKIRYSRQILLADDGSDVQNKLKAAKVLVAGAGGLGSPLLAYLAAAGVGHIGIIDDDMVDLSNLQRQLIHDTDKIGEYKVFSAQESIDRINPHIQVETWPTTLKLSNCEAIIKQYDIVAVAVDNFSTRSIINKCCINHHIPQIYGAAVGFEGYVGIFKPWLDNLPCFRCLVPHKPTELAAQTEAEVGVSPTLCGIIGTMQANEVIRELIQLDFIDYHQIHWVNVRNLSFKTIKIEKNPQCPTCGHLK
ncbi:MAG: HesA/MoeB/ThiF family protein [Alphaproteobacteria bacterium]